MANRDKLKTALDFRTQVVIAGDGLVRDHEVRRDQIPHRQILADQVAEELNRLTLQLRADIAREVRESLAIRLEHLELIERQPLRRELRKKPAEARIGNHAIDFGVKLPREHVRGRQTKGRAIGRAVPQKIGELRSELIAVERLGRGGRGGFGEEQELRRRQDHLQRILDRRGE